MSGQRPWIVQLSEGPVEGSVSQNCVWSNKPYTSKPFTAQSSFDIYEKSLTPGASKQHVPSALLEHDSAPLVLHPELTLLKRSMGPKLRENMVSGFAEVRAAREPRTTSEATMARDGEERNGSV